LIYVVSIYSTDRRKRTKDDSVQPQHHRHHHRIAPEESKLDDVANEVIDQIANSRMKATSHEDAKSPLDKINVGELSCRARTTTNVGLD